MQNLAVVIGVSNYFDAKNNLPGCKADAEAINLLLEHTGKFESILYVNESESSAKTKELLTNFIAGNKGKPINEFFFYFTGHGEFTDHEFYYLLSDFEQSKRNQTSLQNSEIDDLVRTLGPKLFVKVVDACQSGTAYIKENNFLKKYLNESQKGFNYCYFFYSSLYDQSSYQDSSVSDFTFSFINAIKGHSTNEIRYKDIIDVISDNFENNQRQTPYFVSQAEYTEKFCVISSEMKGFLESFDPYSTNSAGGKNSEKKSSLVDLVTNDAKDYVDKEGAHAALQFLRSNFESFTLDEELNQLYKVQVGFQDNYQGILKLDVIANWIESNKNEYFAETTYEESYSEYGELYYEKMFTLKVDVPFKCISIFLNSEFPNIHSYKCNIVFILSRKSIQFFYTISNFIEETWDNRVLNIEDLKWTTTETKIVSEPDILRAVQLITRSFIKKIKNDLQVKFEKKEIAENPPKNTKKEQVDPKVRP